jgi:hypothetical protein
LALLIFMRRGLTFSVVSATGSSPAMSSSMSDMSMSSAPLASVAFFGLRPRLAPVLAEPSASAGWTLGGRPGFFLTTSSVAAALTGFFTSSLADAFSEGFAGVLVAGTGFTFVAGFWVALAAGFAAVLTTLSWALGAVTGLIGFLATGFVAGFTSFPDF